VSTAQTTAAPPISTTTGRQRHLQTPSHDSHLTELTPNSNTNTHRTATQTCTEQQHKHPAADTQTTSRDRIGPSTSTPPRIEKAAATKIRVLSPRTSDATGGNFDRRHHRAAAGSYLARQRADTRTAVVSATCGRPRGAATTATRPARRPPRVDTADTTATRPADGLPTVDTAATTATRPALRPPKVDTEHAPAPAARRKREGWLSERTVLTRRKQHFRFKTTIAQQINQRAGCLSSMDSSVSCKTQSA